METTLYLAALTLFSAMIWFYLIAPYLWRRKMLMEARQCMKCAHYSATHCLAPHPITGIPLGRDCMSERDWGHCGKRGKLFTPAARSDVVIDLVPVRRTSR